MMARTVEQLRTSLAAGVEFHRLSQHFETVEGFPHTVEGVLGSTVWAKSWPVAGATVEIGGKGRSTCWLAAGCQDGHHPPVVAVDNVRSSPEYLAEGANLDLEPAESGSKLSVFRRNFEQQNLDGSSDGSRGAFTMMVKSAAELVGASPIARH